MAFISIGASSDWEPDGRLFDKGKSMLLEEGSAEIVHVDWVGARDDNLLLMIQRGDVDLSIQLSPSEAKGLLAHIEAMFGA